MALAAAWAVDFALILGIWSPSLELGDDPREVAADVRALDPLAGPYYFIGDGPNLVLCFGMRSAITVLRTPEDVPRAAQASPHGVLLSRSKAGGQAPARGAAALARGEAGPHGVSEHSMFTASRSAETRRAGYAKPADCNPPAFRQASKALALTLLAVIAFFGRLGARDITTSHEGRVVQPARHMAAGRLAVARPHDGSARGTAHAQRPTGSCGMRPDPESPTMRVSPWLVPSTNGRLRLQKPPLASWCDAIVFKSSGGGTFDETAARLPPGACSERSARCLMFDLGRRLIGADRRVGGSAAVGLDAFRSSTNTAR
jgi:hypothetical protein